MERNGFRYRQPEVVAPPGFHIHLDCGDLRYLPAAYEREYRFSMGELEEAKKSPEPTTIVLSDTVTATVEYDPEFPDICYPGRLNYRVTLRRRGRVISSDSDTEWTDLENFAATYDRLFRAVWGKDVLHFLDENPVSKHS